MAEAAEHGNDLGAVIQQTARIAADWITILNSLPLASLKRGRPGQDSPALMKRAGTGESFDDAEDQCLEQRWDAANRMNGVIDCCVGRRGRGAALRSPAERRKRVQHAEKIAVADLSSGMHIHEFRAWMEHPFWRTRSVVTIRTISG